MCFLFIKGMKNGIVLFLVMVVMIGIMRRLGVSSRDPTYCCTTHPVLVPQAVGRAFIEPGEPCASANVDVSVLKVIGHRVGDLQELANPMVAT